MEVQFKDILIQPLPSPTADNSTSPGFHVRTIKTKQGERKYTVSMPEGYNGEKAYPVVLFLHGAGERGDDGIVPAQVGLGPAIRNRPGGLPAIAVFPQARRTWAAGSDDIQAALQALDDVMTHFKVDRSRVILTGLSMGGRGSWELAAAHPERFVAVVPICGPGKAEDVTRLKALPIWAFCGDADRDATVINMRSLIQTLKLGGDSARLTEFRGVGHNSWDRAYNDPALIDWMLAQRKP
jgi:predicted peptidase